jgi:hypothetical protein
MCTGQGRCLKKKDIFYLMKKLQSYKPAGLFYRLYIHFGVRPVLLRLFIITTLLTHVTNVHSQKMKGLWKGSYESGTVKQPIYLNFLLNADSTYTIYSYSWMVKADGSDTTCVCEVAYQFLGKDSLYLEEQYIILPQSPVQNCLQKMYLRLTVRKNNLELKGTWKTTGSNCEDSGYISFYKKKKN